MEFISEINKIYSFYEPTPFDSFSGNIIVKWGIDIEARSWGWRGGFVTIYDVSGRLLYETIADEREEKEIDIKSLGFEIDTVGTADLKLSADICPYSLEINFKDKTIYVNF